MAVTTIPPIDVLVVCTGNICRSPMAEGLLREQFARAGVDAHVHSAGLVTQNQPASAYGVAAMARRGIDIGEHRSRLLAAADVRDADLIIGMELQHVREVAVLDRDAFARTFTLPQLARAAQAIGPRAADESVAAWIRRAGVGRRPADMLGSRPEDEVEDPIGRSASDYEATAVEIEGLIDTVVGHLFPTRVP